ncbi:Rossmann-fold NAD(P)-binding domain-containing protein [Sphingobacterium haloxyli]|uniref:hypothetical protein n=1 Tax=Sphingobacterium haloxyli TaxID=2100533 RepID=UPI0010570008|nr:hypothetical protein [Sphingobacterium haloxyli]
MRILIIGASGTIGKKLSPSLKANHEIITAGRSSGDYKVDITSEQSIVCVNYSKRRNSLPKRQKMLQITQSFL